MDRTTPLEENGPWARAHGIAGLDVIRVRHARRGGMTDQHIPTEQGDTQ